jgi:membrane-bound lytic murein transglycosylase MltF
MVCELMVRDSPPRSALCNLSCLPVLSFVLLSVGWIMVSGCAENARSPNGALRQEKVTSATPPVSSAIPTTVASSALPITLERRTGDLDAMLRRHEIRALLVYSHSGFFYDKGQPKGISYETLEEFQRFANRKLRTGRSKIRVTFLPLRVDQLEPALVQGVGDVIASGISVAPEDQNRLTFTAPVVQHAKEIIVSGPTAGAFTSVDDLSGKEIYGNPITAYYDSLQRLNESLRRAKKPQFILKAADKHLTDEDLLQMVNAGLIPATATLDQRAQFWSQVFPKLRLHRNIVLQDEGQLAWMTRKDSPRLKHLLDQFIEGHRVGTSFGNTLLRRYLQTTKWVRYSTSNQEIKKFELYVDYFKKYAAQYKFDYLMLVAQGYQESGLNQNRRNPSGAVGIMQVVPKYAAAPPINIRNVLTPEGNIHAGTKMLRHFDETYFKDEGLDQMNETLLSFASYNAGPSRIAKARDQAKREGLDPDQWFDNVELVVAREVGQETVQYVSNIYKYYVAYKLALEHGRGTLHPKVAMAR